MLYTQNQGLAKRQSKIRSIHIWASDNLYKNEKGMALSYSDNGLV